MGIKRPICNICGGLGYIIESEATEVSLEMTRPCNCSVEYNRLVVDELQSQITQLKAENERLRCCGNCGYKADQGHFTETCHNCTRNISYHNPVGCTDNWQPNQSTNKERV